MARRVTTCCEHHVISRPLDLDEDAALSFRPATRDSPTLTSCAASGTRLAEPVIETPPPEWRSGKGGIALPVANTRKRSHS